ncbi:MAG: hypothetical protein JO060_08610 [Candidatus Eremiobacteraeota bacterium]|nr:hypothetical protein [Candidatus Eremiobacteraeota bacterium]
MRPPVVQSPIPSPNPTVSALFVTTTTSVAQATSGNVFPPTGQGGLVEFNATETDNELYGQIAAVPITWQTYYNYVPDSNPKLTDVYAVGAQNQLETGTVDQTSFTTIYGKGNGLLDVVPEPSVTGQSVSVGPANNAAMVTTETDADGQVTTRSVNADGSYQENVTYPDGTTATAWDKRDLSAFLSWPLLGDPGGQNSTVSVSPPSGGNIPITVVYAPGVIGPSPEPVQTTVPNWYPTTSLYQQTYINKGPTALPVPFPTPTGIPTPSAFPFPAGVCNLSVNPIKNLPEKPWSNLLIQKTTTLDTLFGEAETVTANVWDTQGVGMTCSDTFSTTQQFYDYSGQSAQVPLFQQTPVQITSIEQQLSVNQASIHQKSVRRGGTLDRRVTQGLRTGGMTRNVGTPLERFQGPLGLVPRGMVEGTFARLERERLRRHALLWRQLKTMRFNPIQLRRMQR